MRVWDTRSGQRLMELRRGAEPAEIQCLCFHKENTWLLVGSDRGSPLPTFAKADHEFSHER